MHSNIACPNSKRATSSATRQKCACLLYVQRFLEKGGNYDIMNNRRLPWGASDGQQVAEGVHNNAASCRIRDTFDTPLVYTKTNWVSCIAFVSPLLLVITMVSGYTRVLLSFPALQFTGMSCSSSFNMFALFSLLLISSPDLSTVRVRRTQRPSRIPSVLLFPLHPFSVPYYHVF